MPNSFWEMVANTPWWVYLIFTYLIYISFLATKPRVISFRQLLILPSIFITLSIISLSTILQIDAYNIFLWSSALFLGIPLGWLQFFLQKIKAIKNESKLYIPGTWSLFFFCLFIFAAKYYYSFELAIDPKSIASSPYAPYILLLYGLFTGLFIGKLFYSLQCYKSGPYLVD